MKITELKSFLEVASLGSFSKAASSLNYAHSSVTAQIKSLEMKLGKRLFIRDSKSVTLTEAGLRLHKYARQIIDLNHEAKDIVRETPFLSGDITVASAETVCAYRLPEILDDFRKKAPDVRVSFKMMRNKEVYDTVAGGTTDVGFMLENQVFMRNLKVITLCEEPVSIYVSPSHNLAFKQKLTPSDFISEHHLVWESQTGYNAAFFNMMKKEGFYDFSQTELSNVEAMKRCAIAGFGVAALADVSVENEVERGELVRLDFDIEEDFHSFIFWNEYREQTPALKFFIETVRAHFDEKK